MPLTSPGRRGSMLRRPSTLAALALAVSSAALWWAPRGGDAFLSGNPQQLPALASKGAGKLGFRPAAFAAARATEPGAHHGAQLVISLSLLAVAAAAPRSGGQAAMSRKKNCRARCVLFALENHPPRLAQDDDVVPPAGVQCGEAHSEDLLGLHVGAQHLTQGEATTAAPDASSRQRRQRRSSHSSSHRSQHRNVGARLLRNAVTPPEPIAPSFDPSKVRFKLQSGIRMQAAMRPSHWRKEQRAPDSSSSGPSLIADSVSQLLVTNSTSRSLCLR